MPNDIPSDRPTFRVLTLKELFAAGEEEDRKRLARRQWGRWKLDTETLELAFEERRGRLLYFIDLERMGSSAAMLDWIIQVHKKNWCTIEDTGQLVAALQDIFDPQAHLCGFGLVGKGGGTFDATAHLRALYGESEATKP